jgi:hypothetical protein
MGMKKARNKNECQQIRLKVFLGRKFMALGRR